MMNKIVCIKHQKAQGMVEFALVLPILLLIILGIIAFGHLFFSYSSTVSSSREAARFGAAVGITDAGVPRYLDCDAIIASAVRIGLFAGVSPDSVDISYDKGPGTTPFGSCPPGGPVDLEGNTVELGDRIIVEIDLTYNSIVPLVPIPSFPLTATTRRTIVRSLQIGDAPTAESICPLTSVSMTIMGEPSETHTLTSVVGEPVDYNVWVDAIGGFPDPTTADSLYLYDSTSTDPIQMGASPFDAPTSPTVQYTYWHIGTYETTGEYIFNLWDPGDCYDDSALVDQLHVVGPASTELLMGVLPVQWDLGLSLPVAVTLSAVAPGAAQPVDGVDQEGWQGFTVEVLNETTGATCTAILDATGNGSCLMPMNTLGNNTISASFAGTDDYLPSDADPQIVNVVEPPPPQRANTILDITPALPTQWTVGNNLPVSVRLDAVAPGVDPVGGWVGYVVDIRNETTGAMCTATLLADGTGTCSLAMTTTGNITVTATFNQTGEYNGSSDQQTIQVVQSAPDPLCPRYRNLNFDAANGQIIFDVVNSFNYAINITSLDVTWPQDPIARLTQIRFGDNRMGNNCWAPNGPTCIWYDQSPAHTGDDPPTFSVPQPVAASNIDPNDSNEMRLVFHRDLNFSGNFTIVIGTNQAMCPAIRITYP